jgi:L-serine/L-threonine ammonia-lyase
VPALAAFEKPLVVVCGGIGVDLAKLEAWKIQFER